MAFLRQTWTLTAKNLKIIVVRHSLATTIRAFVLPIILAAFLSFARYIFVPPSDYGIGDLHAVRSLSSALQRASSDGRNTVVFVNNGLAGGDIDQVIDTLADQVTSAGRDAVKLSELSDLTVTCRSTLRGSSSCYGAVVFNSSPNEGNGRIWNYTLRADGALGGRIFVEEDDNDSEIYTLPLQRAVDSAIANLTASNNGNARSLPAATDEYPFTTLTKEERQQEIRRLYQSSLTNFLAVAFVLIVIGVCYHMTGHMATEREIGMSQLLDAMMPTKYLWQAQLARLLSHHLSFSIVYLPGWVIGSIIVARGVWAHTNVAVVLIYFILAGFAFTSLSILGAAFFKKAQLSGVVTTIIYILLAILAQTLTSPKTPTVAVLSLLFAPCNFVWYMTWIARWERKELSANLVQTPPDNPWDLPGIVFWIFLIIQIIVYPILGALLERTFHGTTTRGRTILRGEGATNTEDAVRLDGFTKIYKPNPLRRLFSFISKPRDAVVAVDGLSMSARRGQILALLGANGSGKSTTLDSIAGTSKLTSGNITIDGTGGLGIAPQKNVLWDELTVQEHIRIFNRLKSPNKVASKDEIRDLVTAVDLAPKINAKSKTLSGGQKRKLQLGMMLTGGSAVCCVDEVSSGIDPLSRRKIWDILLAERGKRTIILTTHFLDEADLLADHIAILSKGTLRASGSSVELKDRLGAGYRIHVFNARDIKESPEIEGVKRVRSFDVISYLAPSSNLAAQVIRELEATGISDYKFSSPTIEDVFLQVAEEVRNESPKTPDTVSSNEKQTTSEDVLVADGVGEKSKLELLSGRPIGFFRQTVVLLQKRFTVFKVNWFPYVAALLIPIVAAALTSLFVKNQAAAGCRPSNDRSAGNSANYNELFNSLFLVAGPASQLDQSTLLRLFAPVFSNTGNESSSSGSSSSGSSSNSTLSAFAQALHPVNSFTDFNNFVEQNRLNVTPAGWWLGDANSPATVAYVADSGSTYTSVFGQNALDIMLSNTSIATSFAPFTTPFVPGTGNSLQLLTYFCLSLAAYPAFFGLYPNVERRRNVRGLQYSNGVRSLPLWVAYTAFDFAIVLVSSAIVTAVFASVSNVWYHVDYLFLILFLYGLASILLSYVISLFCSNQLSTYAFSAAGQAVGFLVYLIAYLAVQTFAPITKIDSSLLIVHFVISAFVPIGSVVRTLFVALNLFSTTCDDQELRANPGSLLAYGGPILYLILQSLFLFGVLLWYDSGAGRTLLNRITQRSIKTSNDGNASDEEIANELVRVTSTTQDPDGLRVLHLTKSFGKFTAVDNVTFGVQHGEVFALLGPNGAGKSTTISLIRGDLQPSLNGGDVLVENTSVVRHRAAARSHLGVCPQFDAIDSMTVLEHLRFYARIRGIPDIEHNVQAVIRAVGLEAFATRMAHALSGGNKRKLSLGIALMGNPSVVLLDEPSSGLDAAAKRIMWKTLGSIVPGRSILLTTHSMEEADALASRAGILAKRMLAMGTIDNLRERFGDAIHVHLVSKSAPHSTDEEMDRMRAWVLKAIPGAEIETKTYHGQMRFSVPGNSIAGRETASGSAVGRLVIMLEEQKEELGIEHYSCTPTTLDQVFLTIVGRHNIQEEGYTEKKEKKSWWKKS